MRLFFNGKGETFSNYAQEGLRSRVAKLDSIKGAPGLILNMG